MWRFQWRAAGVAGILVATALPAPRSADGRTLPAATQIAFRAEFQHGMPTAGGYATILTAAPDVVVRLAPTGNALLALPLQGGSCFIVASWQAGFVQPSAPTTFPAEICIAAAQVDEPQLNAWMAGTKADDPSLAIPLAPVGASSWHNPTEVTARMFLRGCGGPTYRTLGELRIAAGDLGVQIRTGNTGEPEVDLAATGVALDTTGLAAWSDVLSGCGGAALGLPAMPLPGTSTTFAGTTERPPLDPARPQAHIANLLAGVDDLRARQVLTRGRGKSLRRPLVKSVQRLRKGDPDRAVQDLERFERKVTRLASHGTLSSADAGALLSESAAARDAIGDLLVFSPVPPPDPDRYCAPAPDSCPESPCAYTTYYVDTSDASRRGCGLASPGSAICAFETILEALAQAETDDRCGADLIVAGGSYEGDITLSRNLRIRPGPDALPTIRGSISSTGSYKLVLEGLNVSPGAARGVNVDHPCASVSLDDVVISSARGYGLLQRGGSLDVRDSAVNFTASEPDTLTRGTGVFLTCGVQAVLDNLSLFRNAAAGLQVVGDATEVTATRLNVTDTEVHPGIADDPCNAPALYGAVQVRTGARLTATVFTVFDSSMIGFLVAGEGAVAVVRDGGVFRTRALAEAEACAFGHNFTVLDDGSLDATDFSSSEADLAGVVLARGGVADLRGECPNNILDEDGELVCDSESITSVVSDNAVGANVQTEGFDVARLRNEVAYRRNAVPLDATALPVPQPLGGVGGE